MHCLASFSDILSISSSVLLQQSETCLSCSAGASHLETLATTTVVGFLLDRSFSILDTVSGETHNFFAISRNLAETIRISILYYY